MPGLGVITVMVKAAPPTKLFQRAEAAPQSPTPTDLFRSNQFNGCSLHRFPTVMLQRPVTALSVNSISGLSS